MNSQAALNYYNANVEDYKIELCGIDRAIQEGNIDNELWNTNELFKTIVRKFNKDVAASSPEPWIPIAKLVLKKAFHYLERDEEEHEFDSHPNLQLFLEDFRKNYYQASKIVGKFLYEHADGDPICRSDQW
jgi:hypothetical protein